jgi:hypothetical protein
MTHGCAPCAREAKDLRASIVGRRVQWVTASLNGTVMTVTDVSPEGLVAITAYTGLFSPHLFREVVGDPRRS